MIQIFIISTLVLLLSSCSDSKNTNQENYRLVGGPCEGCEAILEYEGRKLSAVDTLADFDRQGIKIKVSGIIYQNDGKTPAKDVILYVYHTNQRGIYANDGEEKGWAEQHGSLRTWLKTDKNGQYTFYTLKPGAYPDGSQAIHIHPIILEPNGKYYWLNSYFFADDSLLTKKEIYPASPRGGSRGLLTLVKEGEENLWVGRRDFILGSNIPNYD